MMFLEATGNCQPAKAAVKYAVVNFEGAWLQVHKK
jgi:hypothetical protein